MGLLPAATRTVMEKPKHGGHLIAQALRNEGVRHLFTLSGGHIAPIYDGCVDLGIEVVDFRHEQAATHAADGWARLTLGPGVAAVTAGPGLTDSVTGIANAFYANSPVLVLSGKNPIAEFEMGSLQEMDQVTLVRSVTKWAKTCYDTRALGDSTRFPVFLNSLGRGSLSPTHPSSFAAARKFALQDCDVLLALGVDW